MTATLQTRSVRRRFVVRGVVQGVGYRPFVHATATSLNLSGEVHNDAGGLVSIGFWTRSPDLHDSVPHQTVGVDAGPRHSPGG